MISTIVSKTVLIVETADALSYPKKVSQKVKDIVNHLKTEKRIEADEHITCYRPWGSYTMLEEGPRYKINRIVVNPGAKLSMQMHYHRPEHWS
jgi:mannose-1-phosphate guanylyltransferase/mannose-6-phosphate isomerase